MKIATARPSNLDGGACGGERRGEVGDEESEAAHYVGAKV